MTRTATLYRGEATLRDLQDALDSLGVKDGQPFVIASRETLAEGAGRARSGDPDTSQDAAASIDPEALIAAQEAVLETIREAGHEGMTDVKLIEVYRQTGRQPEQSDSGLRTRSRRSSSRTRAIGRRSARAARRSSGARSEPR